MIEQVILSKEKYYELLNKAEEAEKTIKKYNKLIESNSLTNIQISFPNIAFNYSGIGSTISLIPSFFNTYSYPVKVDELEKILNQKFEEYTKRLNETINEIKEIPEEKKFKWFKSKYF